jgi:hypothetical protein
LAALRRHSRVAAQPTQAHQLVEDHRPRPERGQQQKQHHHLDDDVRLQEEPEDRKIVADNAPEGGCVDWVTLHGCPSSR